MKISYILPTFGFTLVFGMAQAQVDKTDPNVNDADKDGIVEDFATWDEDNAGFVDQDEFNRQYNQKYYDTWDTDRNQRLDQDEFEMGVKKYHGRISDYNADTYKDWDMDEDGTIDINEFQGGMYKTYDRNNDGRITQDELSVKNMNKNPTRSTKKQQYEQNR